MLSKNCQIEELVINKANLITDDAGHVKVTGECNFMNCIDLPVTAWFYTNSQSIVVGKIKIELIAKQRPSKPWYFSKSFKNLPTDINYSDELDITGLSNTSSLPAKLNFLDSLYLFDTAFVICTQNLTKDDSENDGKDENKEEHEYIKGLNFCSSMRPDCVLGIMEKTINSSASLSIYGHINLPLTDAKLAPLTPLDTIWKHPETPGIHLQAKLAIDKKWGKVSLTDTQFCIFTPLTKNWSEKNPDYPSAQAFRSKLNIPSANIEINMWADVKWNLPQALFVAECEGINLSNLAALADIGGSKGLDGQLPKSLKPLMKGIDKLELERFSIALDLYNNSPELSMVSFTLGMPNLNWHVWADHFVMESIAVRFEIDNPLAKRPAKPEIEVSVMGVMDVEKVPISVLASSKNNYTLYAQLQQEQTIPLKRFIKKLSLIHISEPTRPY